MLPEQELYKVICQVHIRNEKCIYLFSTLGGTSCPKCPFLCVFSMYVLALQWKS